MPKQRCSYAHKSGLAFGPGGRACGGNKIPLAVGDSGSTTPAEPAGQGTQCRDVASHQKGSLELRVLDGGGQVICRSACAGMAGQAGPRLGGPPPRRPSTSRRGSSRRGVTILNPVRPSLASKPGKACCRRGQAGPGQVPCRYHAGTAAGPARGARVGSEGGSRRRRRGRP